MLSHLEISIQILSNPAVFKNPINGRYMEADHNVHSGNSSNISNWLFSSSRYHITSPPLVIYITSYHMNVSNIFNMLSNIWNGFSPKRYHQKYQMFHHNSNISQIYISHILIVAYHKTMSISQIYLKHKFHKSHFKVFLCAAPLSRPVALPTMKVKE